MNDRTKIGLEILNAAILLGILGDALLRATPWGLNVTMLVFTLVAAMAVIALRRKSEIRSRQTLALNAALLFFGAAFLWRDSIQLKVFDTFAILITLGILTLPAMKIKTQIAGVFHYIAGFAWSGINAFFAPFVLLGSDISWKMFPKSGWSKHAASVVRGVVIALPILLVFGALFMAADAVFEGFVRQTLNIDIELTLSHVALFAVLAWFSAGYLRAALIGSFEKETAENGAGSKTEIKPQILSITEIKDDEDAPAAEEKQKPEEKKKRDWQRIDNSFLPRSFTFGAIETGVILGLINLLFLSFVIFQIPYLFGGMELVQTTPDFKLADYARRGFGELVAVSALVLPILLVSHWLLRKDSPAGEKIYRVLAGIQIILLFVIMLSAAQRLFLLTGNLGYGLTTVRFYPMVLMLWIALVFVWFAVTVLRGAREQFAWGALWLAIFVLGGLHLLNPDDYIVRTNIQLMREGRMFDADYVYELSDDATDAILESLPEMDFEQQCKVKTHLAWRFDEAQKENDFRTLNWSRWKARRDLAASAEALDRSNCPSYSRPRIVD